MGLLHQLYMIETIIKCYLRKTGEIYFTIHSSFYLRIILSIKIIFNSLLSIIKKYTLQDT